MISHWPCNGVSFQTRNNQSSPYLTTALVANLLENASIAAVGDHELAQQFEAHGLFGESSKLFPSRADLDVVTQRSHDLTGKYLAALGTFDLSYLK